MEIKKRVKNGMAKYKDKKSSGCAMCSKPWKHGWEPKHKPKDKAKLEQMANVQDDRIKVKELFNNLKSELPA